MQARGETPHARHGPPGTRSGNSRFDGHEASSVRQE
jgi:hypothetical protein